MKVRKIPHGGFTLIELLIVITIIAILSVIGLAAYHNFLKNSRDVKRQSDLKFIQSALEQYYADNFKYPLDTTGTTCPGSGVFRVVTGLDCAFTGPGGKTYMNSIPKEDPNTSSSVNQYKYDALPATPCNNSGTNCTSYCLYARMENTSNTAPSGCSFTGNYNFGVTVP